MMIVCFCQVWPGLSKRSASRGVSPPWMLMRRRTWVSAQSLNPKPSSTEPCTLMCHLVPSRPSLHPSHWTIPLTHTEEMSNGIILLSPGFKHGQNWLLHLQFPYEHFGWQIYFIYWDFFNLIFIYSIEKIYNLLFNQVNPNVFDGFVWGGGGGMILNVWFKFVLLKYSILR